MKPITQIENDNPFFMSWSPIYVGVAVTLIAGLLLNLFGAGVGFFMFSPKTAVIKPLGIATFIWFILSGMVSTYIGAWVSGRMSDAQSNLGASIYGILVAGMSTFISLILVLTTVGALFSGSFSMLSNVISFSKSAVSTSTSLIDKGVTEVKNIAPGLTEKVKNMMPDLQSVIDKINKKAEDLIPKDSEKKQEVKKQLQKLIGVYLDSDEMTYEEAKDELVNTVVEITGKSPDEINKTVDEWHKNYLEAKEKALQIATDATNKTASILSQMAWMNFFILLGTIFAAVVGAVQGVNTRYRDGAL